MRDSHRQYLNRHAGDVPVPPSLRVSNEGRRPPLLEDEFPIRDHAYGHFTTGEDIAHAPGQLFGYGNTPNERVRIEQIHSVAAFQESFEFLVGHGAPPLVLAQDVMV